MTDDLERFVAQHRDNPDVQAALEDLKVERGETGETVSPQYREPEVALGRRVSAIEGLTDDVEALMAHVRKAVPRGMDLDQRVTAARVGALLRLLPRAQRVLVVQHYFEGVSTRELARRRRTTQQNVHQKLQRAVRDLRRIIADRWEDIVTVTPEDL